MDGGQCCPRVPSGITNSGFGGRPILACSKIRSANRFRNINLGFVCQERPNAACGAGWYPARRFGIGADWAGCGSPMGTAFSRLWPPPSKIQTGLLPLGHEAPNRSAATTTTGLGSAIKSAIREPIQTTERKSTIRSPGKVVQRRQHTARSQLEDRSG